MYLEVWTGVEIEVVKPDTMILRNGIVNVRIAHKNPTVLLYFREWKARKTVVRWAGEYLRDFRAG
jgi:hypothetical protein